MNILAICDTCRHQHTIDFNPVIGPGAAFSDWLTKHPGHLIDFIYPQRSRKDRQVRSNYMEYIHNADIKISYAASSSVTITLASLAASSTLLAGRESTAITNVTNKYLDYLSAGSYTMASSNNQAGTIRTAIVGCLDDTPTWPDVFDGTDSTETVTDQPTYDSVCRIVSDIANDNTADQVWYWGPVALAGFFGGNMAQQFVFFVSQSAHTSTNTWSASGHSIKITGIYATAT